jgi:tetratricopeptide (TPR) repeat protein
LSLHNANWTLLSTLYSELFEQAINVYQDREIYFPEKARALFKRSKVYRGLGKVEEADRDGEEALRLYRLSKAEDTRSLDELDHSDFDNIIVFWSR